MNAVQLNFVLSFSYMATSASPPPSKRLKSSPIPSHPSHSPSLFQEINDYLHHIKCYTDGLHNDHEQPSSSDTTMMWMLRDKLRDAVTSLKLHTPIHKEVCSSLFVFRSHHTMIFSHSLHPSFSPSFISLFS